MNQIYSDPSRESESYSLPNVEVFHLDVESPLLTNAQWSTSPHGYANEPVWLDNTFPASGWYWQPCFPGCNPDGEAIGPFDTEAEAIADAQQDA